LQPQGTGFGQSGGIGFGGGGLSPGGYQQQQQPQQQQFYQPQPSPSSYADLDPYSSLSSFTGSSSSQPQQQQQEGGTLLAVQQTQSHPRQYVAENKAALMAWDEYSWKQLLGRVDVRSVSSITFAQRGTDSLRPLGPSRSLGTASSRNQGGVESRSGPDAGRSAPASSERIRRCVSPPVLGRLERLADELDEQMVATLRRCSFPKSRVDGGIRRMRLRAFTSSASIPSYGTDDLEAPQESASSRSAQRWPFLPSRYVPLSAFLGEHALQLHSSPRIRHSFELARRTACHLHRTLRSTRPFSLSLPPSLFPPAFSFFLQPLPRSFPISLFLTLYKLPSVEDLC
jgi:hypothetical protein